MAGFIAHRINSAHIGKLRDLNCVILATDAAREPVVKAMLEDINDTLGYMSGDETPETVTEHDLILSEDNGRQEYVYDSEIAEATWAIAYLADNSSITVV